jgi:pyruvate/2-oxoglutarate dehydrogenase complex dihydrolipoamide acyltransferase (E2) component
MASIAAMPKQLRPILLALILAGPAAGLLGCGGDNGPAPSIPAENARTLLAKIAEVKANVDVGSCLVASEKTDDLVADIQALPSSVDADVRQALDNGANQLKLLLADPSQCQGPTTTTETTTTAPTTTQETTTRSRPETTTTPTQTQPTTTTPTQTQPTPTTGGSGGIGPGGL